MVYLIVGLLKCSWSGKKAGVFGGVPPQLPSSLITGIPVQARNDSTVLKKKIRNNAEKVTYFWLKVNRTNNSIGYITSLGSSGLK